MSEINPEHLKPENEHYLRLAYKESFQKWLRAKKLPDNEQSWQLYKASRYGRVKTA